MPCCKFLQNLRICSASSHLERTVRTLTEQKKPRPLQSQARLRPIQMFSMEDVKFPVRLSSPLSTLLSALFRRHCALLHQSSALSTSLMLHVPFFFNANLQCIKNDVFELVIL